MFVRSIPFQRIQGVLAVRMWCIQPSALAVLLLRLPGTLENMRHTKEAFAVRLEWHLALHKLFNGGRMKSNNDDFSRIW